MHSSVRETVVDARGLVPVAVKTLQGRSEIPFDLFVWPSKYAPPRLYREKNVPLEAADLQRLLEQEYRDALHAVLRRPTVLRPRAEPRACRRDHSAPGSLLRLKEATCSVLMASLEKGMSMAY